MAADLETILLNQLSESLAAVGQVVIQWYPECRIVQEGSIP